MDLGPFRFQATSKSTVKSKQIKSFGSESVILDDNSDSFLVLMSLILVADEDDWERKREEEEGACDVTIVLLTS